MIGIIESLGELLSFGKSKPKVKMRYSIVRKGKVVGFAKTLKTARNSCSSKGGGCKPIKRLKSHKIGKSVKTRY